jgi:Zn-dependent protease
MMQRMQTPTETHRQFSWMSAASLILFGILAVEMSIHLFGWRTLTVPLGYVAAFYIVVIVHEAGHALATLAVGYRVAAVKIWPVECFRSPSGWGLRWAVRGGPLGSVSVVPSNARGLTARMAVLVAAGPIASFALAVFAYSATQRGVASEWLHPSWVAQISLFVAIMSLVPSLGNDGFRLLALWRGTDALLLQSVLDLGAVSTAGQRPRDWSPELIATASANPDSTLLSLAGQGFLYNYLLESGRLDEAEAALLGVQARTPASDEHIWDLECVWFYARFRRDREQAAEWMKKCPGPTAQNGISHYKALGSLALLEGRLDDADRHARKARAACEPMTDAGLRTGLFDEIDDLLRDIVEARGSAAGREPAPR